MKDFTTIAYARLLESSQKGGYQIISYREFIAGNHNHEKMLVMRHDVDNRPENALAIAGIEREMQARSSYYFRYAPRTFEPVIISAIAGMGHEIGYHYENLSRCRGDAVKAYTDFTSSLEKFRKIVPVSTICPHGDPMSGHDNSKLWEQFEYKQCGIVADVKCDTDFGDILYLTDTGRSWNSKFNRRDKVNSPLKCAARTTGELIDLFNHRSLPPKIIINMHPQRWTDSNRRWYSDKIAQSVKNAIKYFFFMKSENGSNS